MAELTPVAARREMAAFLGKRERLDHFSALLVNKGIEPAAFVAAVQADAIRQPKLAEAILSAPDTLMDCLSVCAASGLLPGSAHGQFYLIPRWSGKRSRTECTFIVGYKGMCDIAYRHPRVFSVRSEVAFIGEEFSYDPSTSTIRHVWNGDVPREKLEDIQAVYAQVELSTPSGQHAGGRPLVCVMTQKQILAARARSETGKKGFGPWIDHPIPMAQKTPLRRLLSSGSVPRQYDLIQLLGKESEQEEIVDPAPTSAAKGVAGLRARLADPAPPAPPPAMPDDPDERRAMLASLRPDEDPGMLSDDEVESQLSQTLKARQE